MELSESVMFLTWRQHQSQLCLPGTEEKLIEMDPQLRMDLIVIVDKEALSKGKLDS